MEKVLVTGGAGFIGSHLSDALIARGYDVHVLDDLSSGRRENVPADATLHVLDIRDPQVHDLFARERFDLMVHHAAQMDVRRSVADPSFDADVNVRGLLNLMEAGRRNGLHKVVFASTGGAIYGEPDSVPQDESHALQPLSPYGITKLASEKYLHYYFKEYGIPYVALRYGNVYGPRQNPHGEAGVIAIFTTKLLDGDRPVINGDGEQTRDYVFVGDVVAANLAALVHPDPDLINIGTSRETSVNELFRILRDLVDPGVPETHGPGKPGEQRRSVLDVSKARRVLHWAPSVDLRSGLSLTVDWFRSRHGA